MLLIAGLLLFVGIHSVHLFAEGWRSSFIDSFGANTWKLLYSVLSLVGLALLVYGYGQSRLAPVQLWLPPIWTRHLAVLLTWLAFVLITAFYLPGNWIRQKLGHPMYAGIKLWAFAHLLANGRLGDVLLFGTFLLWAIAGFAVSRRRDRLNGTAYPQGNMQATIVTVISGTFLWFVFAFWLHSILTGVQPV